MRARIHRSFPGHRRVLVVLVIAVAFLTSYAMTGVGAWEPATATADQVASAPASAGAESTAETGSENSAPKTDPRPKWVCDQQTATAEPVWRGQSSLTFSFNIRNEGTADLKINARGG